jgi:hypothetical protein
MTRIRFKGSSRRSRNGTLSQTAPLHFDRKLKQRTATVNPRICTIGSASLFGNLVKPLEAALASRTASH